VFVRISVKFIIKRFGCCVAFYFARVPDKCFTSFQSPRVESVLLHTVCIKSNCSPTYTLNKQRYIWLAEAEGFTCCKFDFLGKKNSIQTESLRTDHVIIVLVWSHFSNGKLTVGNAA